MKDIFLAVLKIILFVLILPLIIAACISFQNQIFALPPHREAWLFWGVGIFILCYFFVYDFKEVYAFGKTLVEKIFSFYAPLSQLAGYIFPVYSIFFILIYLIAMIFGRAASIQTYFLFALAFSLLMHVVLTARDLHESDKSVLHAHYLFTFGGLLVVNLCVLSLLLAWVIPEYSLMAFLKSFVAQTFHLYHAAYQFLFVDSAIR